MISLDLETTGLDPERHEAWEVGLVDLKTNAEYLWEFPVQDLKAAEAGALQVNGYYERCSTSLEAGGLVTRLRGSVQGTVDPGTAQPEDAVFEIAKATAGQKILGCSVHFDLRFLEKLLVFYGAAPAWHHRVLDLGSFAAGVLGYDRPLASVELARTVSPNDNAHTALGDARWNVTVYRNLVALREGRKDQSGTQSKP